MLRKFGRGHPRILLLPLLAGSAVLLGCCWASTSTAQVTELIQMSQSVAASIEPNGDVIDDARISEDKRFVVFSSRAANYISGDSNDSYDIFVKNLESGLSCTLMPESVDVTVTGSQEALANISASQIKPFVDLSGLGEGTHTATVKFENAPDIDATISSSTATVQVKLKRR